MSNIDTTVGKVDQVQVRPTGSAGLVFDVDFSSKSVSDVLSQADAAEPFEPIELEKRALVTMPGGWKMAQMQAEQPSTTYGEFKHELLNEIARCLNMPFNVAAGNSSGYNYASGASVQKRKKVELD